MRYFHGTRVVDPADFLSRGILPLDRVLDELWAMLFKLVADERTAHEWAAFRASIEQGAGSDWGGLYRLKTAGRIHFGPHGTFVREVLLDPRPPAHDYLGGPEIVEDILRCYSAQFGTNLMERFCAVTRPCIVTFDPSPVKPAAAAAAINSVFWLVYGILRDGHAGLNANGGDNLDGRLLPPERIIGVDICDAAPERPSLYRVVERIARAQPPHSSFA